MENKNYVLRGALKDPNILSELKKHFKQKYPDMDYSLEILVNVYDTGYPNGALITYYTPNSNLLRIELHDEDMTVTTLSEDGEKTFLDFLKTKNAKITQM